VLIRPTMFVANEFINIIWCKVIQFHKSKMNAE
jgi:hypothetical protein